MADGSAQPSASSRGGPDPLIGRMINDRFKVVALIARGGMGKVYRAEQAPLGRTCALKVLNPKYASEHDPEFHKRFFLEASIVSKLTHPNTVTIFDYGRTDDDVYYMAMEYLEGRTLHRAIREEGAFGEERTAHVARQICRSLREAHSIGVIHRDLKPANIFLVDHADEHDFVKVLDFGLVKNVENPGEDLTQAGLFMGSPKYMAPEQIKGEKVDSRTDIYSLGVIMYEMLTSKVPFDRPNSVHIMMAHVNEPPPPMRSINPDIQASSSTEELILKCLSKSPDQRFPSMEYLLNALKNVGGAAMTATLSGVLSSGDFLAVSSSSGSIATGSSPNQPMFVTQSGSGESGPLVPSQPTPPENLSARRQSTMILGLIMGGIVAVGLGGAAYYAMREEPTGPSQLAASASNVVVQPVVASTTANAPAAVNVAALKLDSNPSGAAVMTKEGKMLCSSTPCEVKFEGEDAKEDKEHVFVFSKGGFKDTVETVKVSDKTFTAKLVSP
ncbi:MAG TPA: serine/threonine-protein kinase [Polyangiaceae bacterium]|jgi:serine/threonine-protein kinase|nr:MAG: Serine/threonine-protein kinase PrkC [Deltaproteobacteria bacterium ADurb.Bin207]HNS98534.1 serine/threonine-protein kinase [Polyangiaceae bacterium]HNZ21440.1 serine/threonine-protein kinase [Polyangiaceae bacterium]HOD23757.1 serine/threonine-protein kinase [Polyangiaceae bacterium]HOE51188.1 serine/threonine-protein kinase [Polyangiaceae bacterium]